MPALKGLASAPVDPSEDLELVTGKSRERDDTQKGIDAETGTLVKAYAEAGGAKTAEAKRPRKRYHVHPDDKAALKAMIRRAATLHKVEAVFFKDGVNDKGLAVITHTVGPQPPKKH